MKTTLPRAMYVTAKNSSWRGFYKPGLTRYVGVDTRPIFLRRPIVLNSYAGLRCNPNDEFFCYRRKSYAGLTLPNEM